MAGCRTRHFHVLGRDFPNNQTQREQLIVYLQVPVVVREKPGSSIPEFAEGFFDREDEMVR